MGVSDFLEHNTFLGHRLNSISHLSSHSDSRGNGYKSWAKLQVGYRYSYNFGSDFNRCKLHSIAVANGCCARHKMKAIVPLFTATLFVVCSAFPLYEKSARGQQSNNFCATLAYPQPNPTAYVHLCHTPGAREGITRTHYLCVFDTRRPSPRLISLICMQSYTNLSLFLHYYCRYLHHSKSS